MTGVFRSIGATDKSTKSRRSTIDFIFEDMTTDSTSVLKDRRHPSLSRLVSKFCPLEDACEIPVPKLYNCTKFQIFKPLIFENSNFLTVILF